MTEKELENKIRHALKTDDEPGHASFSYILSKLDPSNTKDKRSIHIKEKVRLNILNLKISKINALFSSKRLVVLVPSFIILFLIFIGTSTFSPLTTNRNEQISKLAEQDESIESEIDKVNELHAITKFDEPSIDDLSNTQNEI